MSTKRPSHHVHVSSSTVKSLSYDPDQKTMEVQFKSGSIYDYLDVAPETYEFVKSSESPGKAIHQVSRNHKATRIK